MRRSRAAVVLSLLAIGLALVVSTTSCLDPTEITLDVSTDVTCGDTKGTTFNGGASPQDVEGATPSTTTPQCTGGAIGTLVATPSGSKDSGAAFVVVMGVDRPVSECSPATKYKGCIVQRRAIRYVKHKPITLPVSMWLVCKDVACDVNSTCARTGKCVPSNIADPDACADGACYPDGDGPDIPGADASGIRDGLAMSDGPKDASMSSDADSSKVTDADADAPMIVVPPPPPAGTLFCPPSPSGCNAADTCCWSRDGFGGSCLGACAGDAIPMKCDRKSDCTNGTDYCCGEVLGQVIRSNIADAHAGGDGRTLLSTTCGAYPGVACNSVICVTSADCPVDLPSCDKTSALWTPVGVFGECITP